MALTVARMSSAWALGSGEGGDADVAAGVMGVDEVVATHGGAGGIAGADDAVAGVGALDHGADDVLEGLKLGLISLGAFEDGEDFFGIHG